jgi:LPS-assembly protein
LFITGLIFSVFSEHILAADDWGLCRAPTFQFTDKPTSILDPVEIESQFMSRSENGLIEFSGQVELSRTGQKIRADNLSINNLSQQLEASGQVIYEDMNYRLQMERLNLDQKDQTAIFRDVEFQLDLSHASGTADEVEKIDDARSRYQNILYTTCDPEDRDWHLKASELLIDEESGMGTAWHARMYFKNVPFFYLPKISFPIDDRRKTGILTPKYGSSENLGTTVVVPFYWNIAPQTDATITPVWFKKRGLQLNTENRYLFENHEGQLDLSYLDDDQLDSERWLTKWQHRGDLGSDIKANILLQEVSDDLYFNDFSFFTTEDKNIKNLERHVTLSHNSTSWQSNFMLQNYQTLDSTLTPDQLPYERLPRITVNSQFQPLANNTQLELRNELVQFDRESTVTGNRLHVVPSVAWANTNSWSFFEPKLQYALTEYKLEDNEPDPNSISRYIPTFSLDSGLIFERLANAQRGWIQTLEPRLYYLYTPYQDQDEIPDFDTANLSQTLSNFFANNRFSGADRIGDANQFTVGLGSRMYSRLSGQEIMNFNLGQIYYLQDRRVSLNGTVDDSSKSDLIAEFSLIPNPGWRVNARLVHDQEESSFTQKNLSVNYARQGIAANFEYFFTDQVLEQVALSTALPVGNHWALIAKVHQSLKFEEPVQNLLGMAYESCCWGIKILASETNDADFLVIDRAIYFEITFKGLSRAGQDVEGKLRNAISGYQPTF